MHDHKSPEPPISLEETGQRLTRIDKNAKAECVCLSKRCIIALMVCLGFIILFGMRDSIWWVKIELEVSEAFYFIIFNDIEEKSYFLRFVRRRRCTRYHVNKGSMVIGITF